MLIKLEFQTGETTLIDNTVIIDPTDIILLKFQEKEREPTYRLVLAARGYNSWFTEDITEEEYNKIITQLEAYGLVE